MVLGWVTLELGEWEEIDDSKGGDIILPAVVRVILFALAEGLMEVSENVMMFIAFFVELFFYDPCCCLVL